MNKSEAVELIKAKDYSVPFNVWEYTALDRACIKMVIRGTWIFEAQLRYVHKLQRNYFNSL